MSLLGNVGLAQLPYMSWLFPVLIVSLGLHLLLLLKRVPTRGFGPFAISLLGVLIVLGSRTFFPLNKLVILPGVLLILFGSLWNSSSFWHFKKLSRNH
jgi:mercuric ion transport protein